MRCLQGAGPDVAGAHGDQNRYSAEQCAVEPESFPRGQVRRCYFTAGVSFVKTVGEGRAYKDDLKITQRLLFERISQTSCFYFIQ